MHPIRVSPGGAEGKGRTPLDRRSAFLAWPFQGPPSTVQGFQTQKEPRAVRRCLSSWAAGAFSGPWARLGLPLKMALAQLALSWPLRPGGCRPDLSTSRFPGASQPAWPTWLCARGTCPLCALASWAWPRCPALPEGHCLLLAGQTAPQHCSLTILGVCDISLEA